MGLIRIFHTVKTVYIYFHFFIAAIFNLMFITEGQNVF